jgi:GT2 family glycosyltransferase
LPVAEWTPTRYNRLLPHPKVTVAIPTLAQDETLADCLRALDSQTFEDFDVVVIDNSGANRVPEGYSRLRVIVNSSNVGFGTAVNQAYRASQARYFAVLNDDAQPNPRWLESLVACAEANPHAGMFASQVRLGSTGLLDSVGMLLAIDGSSKQRGHREAPEKWTVENDCLCPSGSAALYRREMLEQIGLFDERYFPVRSWSTDIRTPPGELLRSKPTTSNEIESIR